MDSSRTEGSGEVGLCPHMRLSMQLFDRLPRSVVTWIGIFVTSWLLQPRLPQISYAVLMHFQCFS